METWTIMHMQMYLNKYFMYGAILGVKPCTIFTETLLEVVNYATAAKKQFEK